MPTCAAEPLRLSPSTVFEGSVRCNTWPTAGVIHAADERELCEKAEETQQALTRFFVP